jgi:hypothetical protein
MEVSPGGYKFYSSYKLKIPATSDKPASELKVHAVVGLETGIEKSPHGKVFPSVFLAALNFKQNGTPACMEALYGWDRKIKKAKENISSSSVWHEGLESIFHEVVDKQFDTMIPWLLKERNNWLQVMKTMKPKSINPKEAEATTQIQALPGCKLETTYSIRFGQYLSDRSPLSPRIVVHITAKKEPVASFGNKKMLTLTATFCTQRMARMKDPESTIKFVQTKNGLREIGRMDVPGSSCSVWYPWIKKVVKRGAVQYGKLKKIHNTSTSKSIKNDKLFQAQMHEK